MFSSLWVDLFIEEALGQDIKFPILLSDSMGTHKLKLFECKLVKLIFDFPDVRLLQLGYCLFGERLLLSGLSQMGLLSWSNMRQSNECVSSGKQRDCSD